MEPSEHQKGTSTTMHIGELAELTQLSLRTIRHYDEVGLLRPSGRTHGGFRLYTAADQDRLLLIRRMRALSYTLDEIAQFLQLHHDATADSETADSGLLHAFEKDALLRRHTLARQLAMADEFIDQLQNQ